MEDRFVIIDGNSLINRAYYAMQRPMTTKDGVYTQGIYGFLNMLNKIMEEYEPGYIAVAWDKKAPTFRHKAYDGYKAGRRRMPPELAMEMPIAKEIMEALNITNLELEGFEADDIIGTLAKRGEEADLKPLVITGDKDALQLASDKTHVLVTKKGISEFDLYDDKKMMERYELTPEQFIDLKGLMGDSSDNLPGIPGVGEKTGIKLLKQFGSVAELLSRTDEIKNEKLRQKVEDNAQQAAMCRRLAQIETNAPVEVDLEDLKVKEPDYDRLIEIFKRLEFHSFLKKLQAKGIDVSGAADVRREKDDPESYTRTKISDAAALEEALSGTGAIGGISDGETLVIKVFGNNDHIEEPVIKGIALLHDSDYFYIRTDTEDGAAMEKAFIDFLNSRKLRTAGHDLSADYYSLIYKGVKKLDTAYDTAVAEYVLDASASKYELTRLATERAGIDIRDEKAIFEDTAQIDLLSDDSDTYADYGFEWCRAVRLVYEGQKGLLRDEKLDSLCEDVEFPLVEVLSGMEVSGVNVDEDVLSQIGEQLQAEADTLQEKIYEEAGEEFNINSPVQLSHILFEKLGLPAGKKTKRGYSTSAEVLEKLRDKAPVVDHILEFRTVTKLKSTYVDGLKPLISSDGKIHAHYQQTVAATGRLSCTEPNLQNIPVRSELGRILRKAFNAGEGCVFTGADYSQVELRVLAHMSGDENLISAFNNGEDIHRTTASRVFDIPYDEVTKLDRSRAKAVNFGIVYGMSSFGLAEEIHVSRREAEQYIAEYFVKHPDVKKFMDEQIRFCKENRYSRTILGRRRYINEINSSNYMTRQLGERLAMNSPIQGTAADIIKIAMNKVYNDLREKGMKSELVMQIHDELIIRTAEDELDEVKAILKEDMEHAMDLKVRLICDMNSAYTWYDLK
jgi:DNA polymerase-1